MFERRKPNQLQIEVVVGHGTADILHKKVDVVHAAIAFERRAERAADILTPKTTEHFVFIVYVV